MAEDGLDFLAKAELRRKGHFFEDFEVGRVFEHHWGRTLNEGDNSLFSTLTLHFNPLYFNAEYARAHGHPGVVLNPLLVFNVVFGLSVEDLSEGGGAFLGVDELTFHQPLYAHGPQHRGGAARHQELSRDGHRDLAHRGLQ